MQPAGAGRREALGQLHRVAVVAPEVEVAPGESHGRAPEDVDGGIEVHQPPPAAWTKLARTANPVAPDFSGWNCVPHTRPASAVATTNPP